MIDIRDWLVTAGPLLCSEPVCLCSGEAVRIIPAPDLLTMAEVTRAVREHRERYDPDGKL